MINYIKYGFGITIGVLLATGVLSTVRFPRTNE